MHVDQSLFGFRSEHLIGTLSAPHQCANAERWLAARTRRHGCCSRRALHRPRLRAAALSSIPTWRGEATDCVRAFQCDPHSRFESRTMIVPHQSPSACQTELTGSSSSSTVAGDQRNLLVSVAIRSSWPLRWCLSAPSHCTRTLPIPGHLCSEAQSLPAVLAAR